MIRKIKNIFHLLEAVFWTVYYGFPAKKLTVIGVTGTEGKTTTVNIIHHILISNGIRVGVWSTLSSAHTTTPSPKVLQKFLADGLKQGWTHVILEVSSHSIDQNRIWGIDFKIGALTNITGNEHLDYHRSFAHYQNTKLRWLKTCRHTAKRDENYKFETKLVGEYNRENCLTAIAVTKLLGIPDSIIHSAVASFEAIPGRFEKICNKPFTVIIDFGHTPQSFEKNLPLARIFLKTKTSKLIHVFGATGDRYAGKRPVMAQVSAKFSDVIILTHEDTYSENLKLIIDQIEIGIPKGFDYLKIYDRREAIKKALELAKPGDVVIITGVGHQKSLNIAGREVPWSDQETVKSLMKDLSKS